MGRRTFTPDQIAAIVDRYNDRTQPISVENLAAIYGCCYETLRQVLLRNGAVIRPAGVNQRIFTDAEEAAIVARYNDREKPVTIRALADEYGCCHETMRRVLIRHGVHIRGSGVQKPRTRSAVAPAAPKTPPSFADLSPNLPRAERARRQLAPYFQAQAQEKQR
jgi:hypothetical protein